MFTYGELSKLRAIGLISGGLGMDILSQFTILFIFLFVLARSSQFVVESAVKLARFFKIGEATIGFILISTSTSLPELSVSLISSSANESALAVGTAIGSNITDLCVVLGIAAFISTIYVRSKELLSITRILLVTSIIVIVLMITTKLDRLDGLILLALFAFYIYTLLKEKVTLGERGDVSRKEALRAFLFFAVGIAGVIISSGFVVDSAIKISDALNLARSFIGATILAVGTSLPELAVGTTAVSSRHSSLALGDAIGSCMVNLTLVLGVAALINPPNINMSMFDVLAGFLLITNMVFWYILQTKKKLNREYGAVMLLIYAIFLSVLFWAQGTLRV
ncbi:MAG: sodium:calcium antiporter [Candidatus Micrarchaeota archaeon]